MDLLEFWKSMSVADREDFAARCKTTTGHLRNVAYGSRSCAESLAVRIEQESSGKVTCESLCPDFDWAYLRNSTNSPLEATSRKRA